MRLIWRVLTALTLASVGISVGFLTHSPEAWASARAQTRVAQGLHVADVDDFVFESFHAEYELTRDDDGHSVLRTVEHIVAIFPDYDQNRGFIRDIPQEYNGFDTEIEVISVTDETGQPRPYSTGDYNEYLAVTMAVPEGSFVHGQQTYVLEYTQRNVTNHFDEAAGGGASGVDEFYWDVNGTEWVQPFGRVSARLTMNDDLAAEWNGDASCYRGSLGSSTECAIAMDGSSFVASEENFGPRENLTIAVGFEPGTFTLPQAPFWERFPILVYAGIASFLASLGFTVFWTIRNRSGEKTGRAIIARYEPPTGISAAIAAEMVGESKRAMTATLLDFAVRRNLRLLYDEPSGMYGIQALSDHGLDSEEAVSYRRIFGGKLSSSGPAVEPGTVSWFDRKSTRLGDAAAALRSAAKAAPPRLGLTRKPKGWPIIVAPALAILGLALPIIHAVLLGNDVLMTVLLAVGINVLVWLILGMVWVLATGRARTMAGAELTEHLMGLREYIRLAEADRIRMLQSASGAEVSQDRIVQVYERLLPYAVIFGYEKEWQGELARYYRESTPDWAAGTSDSALHFLPLVGLHSAVSSSPVTQSTSSSGGSSFSSSSGSSGGGFSGGGGGGGGGRGI